MVGTRKRVQTQVSIILNSSAVETRCAMTDANNSDPASEVGSGPLPSTVDASWKTIMELQNKNLIELVRAIQSTASSSAVQNKSVQLPKLNPDKSGANASSWCTTVEIILIGRHASSVLDVSTIRGPNIDSDHYLVAAKLRTCLCAARNVHLPTQRMFDIEKLQSQQIARRFAARLSLLLSESTAQQTGMHEQ